MRTRYVTSRKRRTIRRQKMDGNRIPMGPSEAMLIAINWFNESPQQRNKRITTAIESAGETDKDNDRIRDDRYDELDKLTAEIDEQKEED